MLENDTGDAVLLDVGDGVATVTLNRPERRNALSPDVMDGLTDAFEELESSDVRCVVVTGSEGVFCAGGDIESMGERERADPAEAVERITNSAHELVETIASLPLPVVAKLGGPAFGAGGAIALACDVRVASTDAKIGFGFRQVGLTIDSGISHFLPRMVGRGRAKDLVFSGELLDAERAADLGLFERVFDAEEFDERADQYVQQIASGPTAALRHSKRLLDSGGDRALRDALQFEATAQATLMETADHEEGVSAFREGRAPEFEGH
ncbi:enoyl-CoA hydratase/isomerase family protein [Halomarina halobia]|uniref:Enoyl-CoA hydratase/isomerase family protein n=1 Tax=Halomarina halobia TaxID=3033386 RepID=A0ABD6ACU2_9EURY|nr:enoyl-CoA hydratase-related protein [Halomarina sp. PSR21]